MIWLAETNMSASRRSPLRNVKAYIYTNRDAPFERVTLGRPLHITTPIIPFSFNTVKMPSLSKAHTSNAGFSPSYLPVALFVGGTSGIGQATAQAFARSTNGNAHIIICGRNRATAEATMASFPKSSKSRYEFVQCDVSLLKNVHATTADLLTKIPKLNFLVLSSGYLTSKMKDRDDTSEGLPKKLVTDYYARWTFVYELMPLLKKAKETGEDAKVLSVLAPGRGGPIDLKDLGMEKEYSVLKEMGNAATYNDLMIEVSSPHPSKYQSVLTDTLISHSQLKTPT
jgi:hypothetical protein